MYELKVKYRFSSAHYLREYNGKCENLHGHNWKVELILRGEELDKIGILYDFTKLKKIFKGLLDNTMDHVLVNDVPYFQKHNPSAENLAKYLYTEYSKLLNNSEENKCVKVYKVVVYETDDASAAYMEEK